jgi:EmrB/QacA subfamily drug resistance transporter
VPAIIDDLGGFTEFPWLFSVYLLAQAVSVPIYGKLADLFGRKPLILVGVGLFVLGSVLCGIAWSMSSLIAFRVVQGLGAGAVQPIGMTIVGDIYSLAERAKVQGYLASVWAISSVVGPTLGGLFADYLSWRWIFFVNVPVGAAAAWMLVRRFTEQAGRRGHRIDYAGAALLGLGGTLLLLGLLEGGVRWPWDSPMSIGIFTGAAALLVLFVLVERRAAEPILPLWVFRHRVLNSTNAASLIVGVLVLGLSTYVPLFAQEVFGSSAVVAGFALAAMSIGWPIAASVAGRLYLTIGFRWTLLLGTGFVTAGSALLIAVDGSSSVLHLALACFVLGIGFGFVASPAVVAAQSSVAWTSRGVATGAAMFSRSIGSAVGVAVFAAVANHVVTDRIAGGSTSLENLPASVLAPAVQAVFLCAGLVGLLLVAAAVAMPHHLAGPDRE